MFLFFQLFWFSMEMMLSWVSQCSDVWRRASLTSFTASFWQMSLWAELSSESSIWQNLEDFSTSALWQFRQPLQLPQTLNRGRQEQPIRFRFLLCTHSDYWLVKWPMDCQTFPLCPQTVKLAELCLNTPSYFKKMWPLFTSKYQTQPTEILQMNNI